jgi:hypothetical protein
MILTGTLLSSVVTFANAEKEIVPVKKVYQVLEGDSMEIKGKPGLAIDLSYKSQHVEVGEVSDVNITLVTELNKGTLKVNMKALEDDLTGIEEEDLEFTISGPKVNYFPINLEVSSATEGIHYINLNLSVEGEGSRVFAVPVNIGTVSNKIENKTVETTDEGMTISVSSADEEIK